jgi:hypothetical protein
MPTPHDLSGAPRLDCEAWRDLLRSMYRRYLSFPKIPSDLDSPRGQNHHMIFPDVCNPARARNHPHCLADFITTTFGFRFFGTHKTYSDQTVIKSSLSFQVCRSRPCGVPEPTRFQPAVIPTIFRIAISTCVDDGGPPGRPDLGDGSDICN